MKAQLIPIVQAAVAWHNYNQQCEVFAKKFPNLKPDPKTKQILDDLEKRIVESIKDYENV